MLTGSLAAAFYGTPRATQDVDLVIEPQPDKLQRLVDNLRAAGLYADIEAAREALRTGGQFNAIDPSTGWKVDLIFRRARPFSKAEFERRQQHDLFGVEVALATLEDLIIAKLEWSEWVTPSYNAAISENFSSWRAIPSTRRTFVAGLTSFSCSAHGSESPALADRVL